MNMPKIVGVLLVAFATLFLLFVFAQVSSFLAVYQGIAVWISANSTLDENWTALLAAIATVVAWGAIPGVLGFVIFGKSSPQLIAAVSAVALVLAGVLFFAGGEAFFTADGRPTRCYGMTPDGIKIAAYPQSAASCPIDRTYSTPMFPMSADIVPSVLAARRGIVPARLDVETMTPEFSYFDASTGRPNVYYFVTESGEFELFSGSGFHPSLQVPLIPITRETADKIRRYVTTRYKQASERRRLEAQAQLAESRQKQIATPPISAVSPESSSAASSTQQEIATQQQDASTHAEINDQEDLGTTVNSNQMRIDPSRELNVSEVPRFLSSTAEEAYKAYAVGDYLKAAEKFSMAAAAGDARAAGFLGLMYKSGLGVAQDDRKAIELLKQSAESGEPGAAFNLGDYYAKGLGVRRSSSVATKWYRLALEIFTEQASQGGPEAMYMVGRMNRDGLGTKVNDSVAIMWFERASNIGNAKATRALGEMYLYGRGVRLDRTEGLRLIRLAAQKDDSIARQILRSRGETW